MIRSGIFVILGFALSGCATPDPCEGQSGACLNVQVRGVVGTLTALRLDFSGALQKSLGTALPPEAHTTPFATGVLLPEGVSGALALTGVATNGSATVALGMATVNIGSGAHAQVTLNLHSLSGPSCQDGVRDGDETDIDCGGSCPRCASTRTCAQASDCMSAACQMKRCISSMPQITAVSPITGPTVGGIPLVLTGSGLVEGLTVTVNGIPATGLKWLSAKQVTFLLPANPGALGKVPIGVTNPDGAKTVNDEVFSYYTAALSFAPARHFASGAIPFSVVTADFNHDGKADLAVAALGDNSVDVLLGSGDGTFPLPVPYGAGAFPDWVTAGDFNRDGMPDLVAANENEGSISVLLGNGDGTLRKAMNYAVGKQPRSLAVGDWDHDKNLDLAIADEGSDDVTILLGREDGTFVPGMNVMGLAGPLAVSTGDFNGDGKPDLAVVNDMNAATTILIGIGNGTFIRGMAYTTGMRPYSVTTGDFNSDTFLDLAVANAYSNSVSVLLGKGDGTFLAPVDFATDEDPAFVTTVDLDGDGALDLVTANERANDVSVLIGKGNGSFGMPMNFATGVHSESIAIGDFNGDRRLDLAVVTSADSRVNILLNTSQ